MESSIQVAPNIFRALHPPFVLDVYRECSLTAKIIDAFLQTAFGDVLGFAPSYGSKRTLKTLAAFNGTRAILIRFSTFKPGKPAKVSPGRAALMCLLLSQHRKLAFKMDRLAAALYKDADVHINRGVDLLSLAINNQRSSVDALVFVLGGESMLHRATVVKLFAEEEAESSELHLTALQAWAAYQVAYVESTSKCLVNEAEISTHTLKRKHLSVIAKIIRDADRLLALKPIHQKNDVDNRFHQKNKTLDLTSVRFKTRLMAHSNQVVEIQTNVNRVSARVKRVNGRSASLILHSPIDGKIQSVITVGRDPLTTAEETREQITLAVLKCSNRIVKNPFFKRIWLPSEGVSWPNPPSSFVPVTISFPGRPLNVTQTKATTAILSHKHPVTLIQGPPGTGKTTVIAAAITSIMSSTDRTKTVWVVAQSNVAVRNVAEKLADIKYFDFKILVSKDFHFEWHEHLYYELERNVIRSDTFPKGLVGTERLLLGCRVILCTLSMLSNLSLTHFIQLVPPQTIIIDEASQIEVGNYLPPLQRFGTTLRKLVFIGDDKQLPPHGQGDIPELCSIFEMSHLRKNVIFLDTQYRMPTPIGTFISREVYAGRLKSVHPITTWNSCSLIDVASGREEKGKESHSWMV
ncbi:hypothetical protein H0H87_012480 [Tephrocybe sp. NHM501043]|nr:hypothetical protein H0H87_012480 [Tephrocybe sp. NHM501043]